MKGSVGNVAVCFLGVSYIIINLANDHSWCDEIDFYTQHRSAAQSDCN
jgi:hypothetical protein